MNKSTKILVSISLVLNVLLIGVMIGQQSHRSRHCHGSKHDKGPFKGKFAGLYERKHEMFKHVESTREEMLKVLTAEKFDPVAYEQKSKELHTAFAQIAESMSADIERTATGLSQADRIELAKELKFMGHHKKHHK